jgi:hypothetical protein
MASPAFVLLTAPEGEFYAYVLQSFAAGFEALGVPCLCQNPPIGLDRLARWAREFHPAAILEINRVLPSELDWPRDVAHLAWYQDHRFNGVDMTKTIGRSDHLYFIVHPDSFGIALPPGRAWSILLPGARLDAPEPTRADMRLDFSMVGYIPAPLDDVAPISYTSKGRVVRLAEFLANFRTEVLSDAAFSMSAIHREIENTCRRLKCNPVTNTGTLQTFDEILVRTLERKKILEAVLTVGGTLEIFGPATWEKWPQFAPHYRGFLADPRRLDAIYQTTRVNLHNSGLTMHFRVMDCLAAGGFMLINETPWDFLPGGIRKYLEPSRHYGAYCIDDVAATAAHFLADGAAREKISAEGRRAVLAEHTWRHRAAQVLRDAGVSLVPRPDFEPAAVEQARNALHLAAQPASG